MDANQIVEFAALPPAGVAVVQHDGQHRGQPFGDIDHLAAQQMVVKRSHILQLRAGMVSSGVDWNSSSR